MSRPDTWMPLYIGDYTADTLHLNTIQHGAYLLMIMHYWRKGPLPNDDGELAGIVRADKRTWLRDLAPVVRRFFTDEGGVLRHKRIDAEMGKAAVNIDQRRKAGIASAEKRKAEREANEKSAPVEIPLQRNGKPSPSPSKEERTVLRTAAEGGAGKAPDARAQLKAIGATTLQAITGLPGRRSHALIGKMLKECGDNCALVLSVLEEAVEFKPAGDPVAWIMEMLRTRGDRREGVADQLGREFNFSIDDLPSVT